tara:strand:+ start:274 stop:510 length:237 start_codon:yes stop_codon:yes gene_type:complete
MNILRKSLKYVTRKLRDYGETSVLNAVKGRLDEEDCGEGFMLDENTRRTYENTKKGIESRIENENEEDSIRASPLVGD